MIIEDKTVANLAHLSRLEFDAESAEKMKKDLTNMLDFVAKLDEVDTTGVEPLTHMSAEMNVMREDEVKDHMPHEAAMALAPNKDSNYIRVPKVKD